MKQGQFGRICTHFLLLLAFTLINGCGSSSDSSDGGGGENPSNTGAYNIGGTTRGLMGTGLTLQNNGADDLVITQNGSFQFSQQVEDGAPCNVTILSQPIDPPQVCEVVDGSQTISGSGVTNVRITCTGAFQDGFDEKIDAINWSPSNAFSRSLVNGALEYSLTVTGEFGNDYLSLVDSSCGSISVDTMIADARMVDGFGPTNYGVRLESCGYHTTTAGEAPGNKIGDVFAAIILEGSQSPFSAYYYVYKCLDNVCSNFESIQLLTPNEVDSNLLGEVALGENATVLIDWNGLAPGQFSFQLNGLPPVMFDPVAAGAPINAEVPNAPRKRLGVKINLSNPEETAAITAIFDNVMVDGMLYDDFDLSTYPDLSLWKKPYGKVSADSGQLMLETAKEYTGDVLIDQKQSSMEIFSNADLIPNEDIIEADIVLDSNTVLTDIAGSPVEACAMVEMGFRPLGADENDWKKGFLIQAGLKEDPNGTIAEVNLLGCVDSSCTTRFQHENQVFSTSVGRDVAHHFALEYTGDGIVNITLDDAETLSFDLSAIPDFVSIEFRRMDLSTSIRGTDSIGEAGLVRAYFDNVRVGTPN